MTRYDGVPEGPRPSGPHRARVTREGILCRAEPASGLIRRWPVREVESGDRLPKSVDVRQMSLFGAGWTLGSLQALMESGVESVTYYETHGWRGLMSGSARMPDKFPALPGVFPLYHVFADVGAFAGGEVIRTTSSQPHDVAAMTLRRSGRVRMMMANLGPDVQHVRAPQSPIGSSVRIHRMDEHNAAEAMRDPERYRRGSGLRVQFPSNTIEVTLRPYSYARIDPA